MPQARVKVHPSARRTHVPHPAHAAQISMRTPAPAPEHATVHDASSRSQAGQAAFLQDSHARSFVIALWSSLLLFAAGLSLVYHSRAPEVALLFFFGVGSLVFAVALFRLASSRLLAHLECEARKEGLSEGAAQQHARAMLERVMVPPQTPPLAHDGGEPMQRLLDRYPLA